LLISEGCIEGEGDDAEREHRRRHDEHEKARCRAQQTTVATVWVVGTDTSSIDQRSAFGSWKGGEGRGARSKGCGWLTEGCRVRCRKGQRTRL
jgi:hypothetical protein